MSQPDRQTKKLFCNDCRRQTNHVLRGEFATTEQFTAESGLTIERILWSCAGCDSPVLEVIEDFTDFDDPNVWHAPKRTPSAVPVKVFKSIPASLKTIYAETVEAYNNDLRVLCAAGLRSLIEGICFDKKIVGKNLEVRIDGLVKFLPQSIVANLHGFRFMGNKAVHELARI